MVRTLRRLSSRSALSMAWIWIKVENSMGQEKILLYGPTRNIWAKSEGQVLTRGGIVVIGDAYMDGYMDVYFLFCFVCRKFGTRGSITGSFTSLIAQALMSLVRPKKSFIGMYGYKDNMGVPEN